MSWKTKLALWLLKLDKQEIVIVSKISDELKETVKVLIEQMKSIDASGEYKRNQVLRALLNRYPTESVAHLNRAIELVLCGAVS